MKEMPLIIFTLTMQAAIGAILWATILRIKDKEVSAFKTNTLCALILSAVGIIASLLHLGKPFLALTTMSNFMASWLSREIFFSGGFFVLIAVFWWLERTNKANSLKQIAGYLACLSGLAAVLAMAKLYMETIIPAWQSVNTLVDFYATTLVLGAIVFYVSAGQKERGKLPRLEFFVLGIVLVQIVFLPNYVAGLGATAGAGQESAALLAGGYSAVVFLRWLLMLGGIFLFLISRTGKFVNQKSFLYTAVGVLIIGEVMGRYLFYTSGIPIGLGIL
ncbi:DMSO reductase anchor subunit [Desulfitobacterium dehalogenans ATCC 51507]|uniref:DMSO reductase anchor subunit n=1 Tax=Desulfitobacterium dehalogenans (strain ATCC 51507 / DSM 9161 / JW/IU-DC1) TaxID=756499 RepID=I4A8Z5_DESDJ|nr:DmsC/YnfH family molybdoenzyme membrane anchor subunit [Desulfitobacterium dehalogenans]AFM00430.1 DMSO reductase anchor subunit [Desulfitobacterium dehalogenans ATCC 51507]